MAASPATCEVQPAPSQAAASSTPYRGVAFLINIAAGSETLRWAVAVGAVSSWSRRKSRNFGYRTKKRYKKSKFCAGLKVKQLGKVELL